MMKINLLGHAAAPTAAAGGGPSPAGRQAASLLVPLLVGLVVVGFLHYYWSSQVDQAKKNLATEQRRQSELAAVQAQNKMYQSELATLQQRIDTIHALQASRSGPVQLMTSLGATVDRSSDLYLVSVNPSGNTIHIQGLSDSVNSIAQFITSLNNSGVFTKVQLQRYYEDDRGPRPSFKFNLDCDFEPPGSIPAQPAAGAGTPPGRPAGK
jgi:Tfp pilus assembly protein PilN